MHREKPEPKKNWVAKKTSSTGKAKKEKPVTNGLSGNKKAFKLVKKYSLSAKNSCETKFEYF